MDEKIEQITVKTHKFRLKYLPGVFSKSGLDDGTKLMINTVEVRDGSLIADLGAGNGILGFYLARKNSNGHVHLLEDHLRSFNLIEYNLSLNRFKNIEVFLSDLFSAVSNRTYHQIFSNPPQQLGNEFLKELTEECYNHLKLGGEVYIVVKNTIRQYMKRLIEEVFGNCSILGSSREHVVLKANKV